MTGASLQPCIRAKGANSVAQAVRVNSSLSSLDMGNNFIGDEGVKSLAEAFRVNTSLTYSVLITSLVLMEQILWLRPSE